MLVYGDHDAGVIASERARQLALRCTRFLDGDRSTSADDALRTIAILSGQLEQAIADGLDLASTEASASATDQAARALFALWSEMPGGSAIARDAIDRMRGALRSLETIDARVQMKVPEGFAFYGLFLEQYFAAAEDWLRANADDPGAGVLVVGVRSIGTTLSAAVAAVLRAHGRTVLRITVRPTGHPFERRVEIDPPAERCARAIVVDEGPGLSGSTMASVAKALVQHGFLESSIAFFPGHGGWPKDQGGPEVSALWRRIRRYVRPDALGLVERRLSDHAGLPAIEAVGGGIWRTHVFSQPEEWPAVGRTFERPKYLASDPRGRKMLFKFMGDVWFRADTEHTLLEHTEVELAHAAEEALGPRPLGRRCGFVAMPFVGDRPLRRDRLSSAVIEWIARFLVVAPRGSWTLDQAARSLERALEIIRANAAVELSTRVRPADLALGGTGADLAPHTFVQSADGRISRPWPLGQLRHAHAGDASLAWDVAGAIVEWRMTPDARDALLRSIADRGAIVSPPAIDLLRVAYAAFKLGEMTLSARDDPEEADRAIRAAAAYRHEIARAMEGG